MVKRNIILILLSICLFVSVFSCTPQGSIAPNQTSSDTTTDTEESFLFLQSAASGSFTPVQGEEDTYTLVLNDISPSTVYFADRPYRETGSIETAEMIDYWQNEGNDDFSSDPPNAALEITSGEDSGDIIVLELYDPVYDINSKTLSYKAKILKDENALKDMAIFYIRNDSPGNIPANFDEASLFIDSWKSFWHKVKKFVSHETSEATSKLKKAMEKTYNKLKKGTISVEDAVKKYGLKIDDLIKEKFTSAEDAIKKGLISAEDAIKKGFIKVEDAIKKGYITAIDAIKKGLISIEDAIKAGWDSVTPTTYHTIPSPPTGGFSMLIASDPQIYWYRPDECKDDCFKEECKKHLGKSDCKREELAKLANDYQVKAMNSINDLKWPKQENITNGGADIADTMGLIINGDLTAYSHPEQYYAYRNYYDSPAFQWANLTGKGTTELKWPIFPGLGNHDYSNNVGDCKGYYINNELKTDSNHCAKAAANYIRKFFGKGGSVLKFFDYFEPPYGKFEKALSVPSFDEGSLAYSFDMGNFHFIQLHNYPGYEESAIGIKQSYDWLEKDLNAASASGKKSIINMHDYGDKMDTKDSRFLNIIKGKSVIALFCGHIHDSNGKVGNISGTNIPYFRSGSSDYFTFLLVEFHDTYMTVGVITSEDNGTPKFLELDNNKKLNTYKYEDIW